MLDRNGLVQRRGLRRRRATGTPLAHVSTPNALWCADYKGRVEIDFADTSAGRDVVALVQRGDLTGMSFSFQVVRPHGERFERRDGLSVRIISDMTIQEISIVAWPAYETDVQVAQRALRSCREGHRIDWLRRWEMVRRGHKCIGPLWKRADARERMGA